MNREQRIGRIGSRPFGAGYMRQIERRAKAMRAATVGRKQEKQQRLPGFSVKEKPKQVGLF